MRHQRWVYLMIIVVGAILAIGIAGVPSTHRDAPVRNVTTSTAATPGSPSGTG